MLIVGGTWTVSGAVIGCLVLTIASEVLREWEAAAEQFGVSQIAVGIILLLSRVAPAPCRSGAVLSD
jgi:ABC-type branched-subunit amino acid transport system permease subunit